MLKIRKSAIFVIVTFLLTAFAAVIAHSAGANFLGLITPADGMQTAAAPESVQPLDSTTLEARDMTQNRILEESPANASRVPIIWNSGSLTFTKTAANQQDCITLTNCLTRVTVLYNAPREFVDGNQGCGYLGPANTEWAYGNIANWSTLTYRRLYLTNGCGPLSMVGNPLVLHLIEEDIYLQVTFNSWQPMGSNFSYTRTTGPGTVAPAPKPFDFDGDSKTDISIFRPAPGEWWYLRSSDGSNRAFQFGQSTDKIIAADYTGDGKTDVGFWRPSSGEWFILRSEDSSFYSFPFGVSTDIPVPADYDGDGKSDPAVFRPASATWFILNSGGGTTIQAFGTNGDQPVAVDYDGDSKADLAIFRPSDGSWWLNRSQAGLIVLNFGTSTDKTVPGDYTGDGKADVAFFRPSSGEWFISRSEDFSFYSFPFGTTGDIPAPGDYDGDAKTDPTVFRPSNNTWFKLQSASGFEAIAFGIANDVPVPGAFVR